MSKSAAEKLVVRVWRVMGFNSLERALRRLRIDEEVFAKALAILGLESSQFTELSVVAAREHRSLGLTVILTPTGAGKHR